MIVISDWRRHIQTNMYNQRFLQEYWGGGGGGGGISVKTELLFSLFAKNIYNK